MTGAELIAAERQRQIDVENWTPEHDDEHDFQELAKAGVCYAHYAILVNLQGHDPATFWEEYESLWPWDKQWWKPSDDPIRNLVKAGALLSAEIDRLQRKAEADQAALEVQNRRVALEELLKQPTSDPEKFVRCTWCGSEMEKPKYGVSTPVCLECLPF